MNKYYLNDWENSSQEQIFDDFRVKKEDRNYTVVFNHLNNYYYLFEEQNYIGKLDLYNKN